MSMMGGDMRESIERELFENDRSIFSKGESFDEAKARINRLDAEGYFSDPDMTFSEKVEHVKNASRDI